MLLVGRPPKAPFDAGMCNTRQDEGRINLGRSHCRIEPAEFAPADAQVRSTLRRTAAATESSFHSPAAVLCDPNGCRTRAGETLLYRDAGHLTPAGSRFVVEAVGLRPALMQSRSAS